MFGGYNVVDNRLEGYCICSEIDNYIDWNEAKFVPDALKNRISDIMEYKIVESYMNESRIKFISSGQRNINHHTNVQEYDIRNFGFRKAYCKMDVIYKMPVLLIIKLGYPFRKILRQFDYISIVHKVNVLFKLESIRRSCQK